MSTTKKNKTLITVEEVVDALGGLHCMAHLTAISVEHIKKWISQKYIPFNRSEYIQTFAKDIGCIIHTSAFNHPEKIENNKKSEILRSMEELSLDESAIMSTNQTIDSLNILRKKLYK